MPSGFVTMKIIVAKMRICNQPLNVIVFSSELLRPQKRVDQVNHNNDRYDCAKKIFQRHASSLQTIAAADIQPRNYKKDHRNNDKYKVGHVIAPQNKTCLLIYQR